MDYLEIVNWHEYQHYKERNPPWIKLHNKILDCYEYGCMQDASKLLLLSLYMLASRTENKIPYDITWIKSKAMLQGKVDVKPLINFGFVKVASNSLAACVQNADSETETYNTTEAETEADVVPSPEGFVTIPLNKTGMEYLVTEKKVSEWETLFPGIDVRQCIRECKAWNIANPTRRKTKSGIETHIVRWLTKANDSGRKYNGHKANDSPVARGLANFLASSPDNPGDGETE